jgi:Protein of unknown function (DUF3408).
MSDKPNKDGIDAEFLISQASKRNRELKPYDPEPQQPVNEGEELPPEDTSAVATKGKSRRRRGNYDDVFLKKKELKTRQPVYISLDVHQRIKNLVQWLALAGKDISVGGYIDNVLLDHLEQHKDEIDDLKRTQLENS